MGLLSPFCVSAVVRYRLGNPDRWQLEQTAAARIIHTGQTGRHRQEQTRRRRALQGIRRISLRGYALETRYSVGDTPSERRNIAEKALGLR